MFNARPVQFSVECSKPEASFLLSKEINSLIINENKSIDDIVIFCIGTDRSTGDCLGPLVGEKLKKNYFLKNANIFGTLNEPVHAKNLEENINQIYYQHSNPLVIAIDASLGKTENIGKVNLFKGSLFPGAGVNKNLRPVGDISITGIVNVSGFMEYIVLQNTRLSLVMQMADVISLGLYMSLSKIQRAQMAIN
jgi:putative sporulation protein YyaC